ncbi:MAG: DUF4831 domain-containing protein [Bacteroidales bacterium 45-6]|nr:MAG: DUF4831 domain-containing protein [Bacteroidales bacterium 45-6]
MKRTIRLFLGGMFLASAALSAQTTVKMSAVKANNYGVAYTLPKTSITIAATVLKTTRTAGEYYQYAERYLNISNPILQNETVYELTNLNTSSKGIPDKANSFLVEFRSNTTSPFVTLTKEGVICAINSDEATERKTVEAPASQTLPPAPLPNPRTFLSEEILSAGSTAKQAELIAKQIYKLRENKNNILAGEADNMPPDGNAYKIVMDQLAQQEKALTEMFTGHETSETSTVEFTVVPSEKNIDKQVLFRFSKHLGVVASDDLSGAPVYLSLANKNPIEKPILTPKEEKAMAEKFSKGIIYNIPGKASLRISFNSKDLVSKEIDVVQYGQQDVLAEKMFDNNKQPVKVIFFPDLGAIKQIIQ